MQPIYVAKTLTAASSNGLGSISTAAPSVVTVNTSDMDTGRRVVFYSTADASTMTLTVFGYQENSTVIISEAVLGSTANGVAATTTADFLSLTSVTVSSNASIPFLIGTSTVGGTPWKVTNWHVTPQDLSGTLQFSSTANGMSAKFDITLDDITGTYQDNHGHTVPQSFNSTSPVGAGVSGPDIGILAVDGNSKFPVAGWRMTLSSSSSAAGSAYGTVLQAGIG